MLSRNILVLSRNAESYVAVIEWNSVVLSQQFDVLPSNSSWLSHAFLLVKKILGIFRCFLGMTEPFLEIPKHFLGIAEHFLEISQCFLAIPHCFLEIADCFLGAVKCFLRLTVWFLRISLIQTPGCQHPPRSHRARKISLQCAASVFLK